MREENIPEKELKKLTSIKELSSAIKKLERKKEAIENNFKEDAHNFFENLNPVKVLNKTLRNIKQSSSSKYILFKKALAFGAGYLSKRKLIFQLKHALINTFKTPVSSSDLKIKAISDNHEDLEINESSTDNKKENNYMNSQIEKVKAKPEVLPEPTYWPFFLALGLVFLGWGLLTTWLISLAGLIVIIVSLTGWINILRHE